MITDLRMTHFNVLGPVPDPLAFAQWHNNMQDLAARTGLGVPITFSTDPRHAFTDNVGTSASAGAFSQWPEPLGFGALRSPELVEQFADIARQEYLAVGLRLALHPQVDLITEPRWAGSTAASAKTPNSPPPSSPPTSAASKARTGSHLGVRRHQALSRRWPAEGRRRSPFRLVVLRRWVDRGPGLRSLRST